MSLYAEWLGIGAASVRMPRILRPRGQLRADILQALRASPGASLMEIHAAVGGNETTLARMLARLTDEGAIKRRGKRNRYTYREGK